MTWSEIKKIRDSIRESPIAVGNRRLQSGIADCSRESLEETKKAQGTEDLNDREASDLF
jgi:hypothetical protein